MYIERPPLRDARDLEQGDILADFFRHRPPINKNLAPLRNKQVIEFKAVAPLERPVADLRAVCAIERASVLVVSASCDNFRGDHPLILAAIGPFPMKEGQPESDQWLAISTAATGTASPRFFYLPANGRFDVERSRAILSDLIVVDSTYMQRCIDEGNTTRRCGLTSEAVRHLQWSIGLVFSRNPRDDFDWPSHDDLRLKLAYVESRLAAGGRDRAQHLEDRRRILEILGEATDAAGTLQGPASSGAAAPVETGGSAPMSTPDEAPEPIVTSEDNSGPSEAG
jgi:hypothetical protein